MTLFWSAGLISTSLASLRGFHIIQFEGKHTAAVDEYSWKTYGFGDVEIEFADQRVSEDPLAAAFAPCVCGIGVLCHGKACGLQAHDVDVGVVHYDVGVGRAHRLVSKA